MALLIVKRIIRIEVPFDDGRDRGLSREEKQAVTAAKAVIEATLRPFGMRVTERSSSSTIEGLDDNSTDS